MRSECFDLQIISVNRKKPLSEFQTELALFIGAHTLEMLDFHDIAAEMNGRLAVKSTGWLAQHPAKPAAQGEMSAFLLLHTAPSHTLVQG